MEPKRDPKTRRGPDYPLMRYGGLGTELAAGIAGFTLIGYWIDSKFDTGNVGLITGATVGSVGGLYYLIRRAMEMEKRRQQAEKEREAEPTDADDQQHTD